MIQAVRTSRRIPSLNWLRVFEAAARTGSFARAATELNMSPPAVSQQVRALEGHLGAALFTRGPRSVTLTDSGRTFLPAVQSSLWAVETTAEAVFGDRRRASLTLQADLLMATSWLPPRLTAFRSENPDVALTLTALIGTEQEPMPPADLRLLHNGPPDGDGDWLFGEWLQPVARPEIAEAIAAGADLLDWPLIEVAGHQASWLSWLSCNGLENARPRPFLVCNSTVTAMSLAAGGGLIALARAPASDTLQQQFGLVPCRPGSAVEGFARYRLMHGGPATLSPAALRFRAWLLHNANEVAGE